MLFILASAAADAGTKQQFDVQLPQFEALPADLRLEKPSTDIDKGPSKPKPPPQYSIVQVAHVRKKTMAPAGKLVDAGLQEVTLSGNPLMSEPFTSIIKIRCPERMGASVEVSITDERGNVAMSSIGRVYFRDNKRDEVDYPVEWEPSPFQKAGNYFLVVHISDQQLGSWPIQFVAP